MSTVHTYLFYTGCHVCWPRPRHPLGTFENDDNQMNHHHHAESAPPLALLHPRSFAHAPVTTQPTHDKQCDEPGPRRRTSTPWMCAPAVVAPVAPPSSGIALTTTGATVHGASATTRRQRPLSESSSGDDFGRPGHGEDIGRRRECRREVVPLDRAGCGRRHASHRPRAHDRDGRAQIDGGQGRGTATGGATPVSAHGREVEEGGTHPSLHVLFCLLTSHHLSLRFAPR